jgi:hypothetical protein
MKRAVLFGVVLFVFGVRGYAQNEVPDPTQRPDATYLLFRTQNIYTLLKLDTRTGQIWQVHWGKNDNTRFTVPINIALLVPRPTTAEPIALKAGRFTLYPTANIYTFMLLDQEDGRAWQVQWGTDETTRFILAIN